MLVSGRLGRLVGTLLGLDSGQNRKYRALGCPGVHVKSVNLIVKARKSNFEGTPYGLVPHTSSISGSGN